jgi:hypothetical protein
MTHPLGRPTLRSFTLIACETILIVLSVIAAAYLRLGNGACGQLTGCRR